MTPDICWNIVGDLPTAGLSTSVRQRNRRYRRLELVRHIVDKIILHLRQLLLAEYDINRKDERHQQYKSKYHRRYHKPDRIEDIILLSRKMYLDDTHTGWWVIQKQWLRIRAFTPFIYYNPNNGILRPFPVYHFKVIIHITETFIYQTCFRYWSRLLKVDTLLNRFVAGIIYHLQHHLHPPMHAGKR